MYNKIYLLLLFTCSYIKILKPSNYAKISSILEKKSNNSAKFDMKLI